MVRVTASGKVLAWVVAAVLVPLAACSGGQGLAAPRNSVPGASSALSASSLGTPPAQRRTAATPAKTAAPPAAPVAAPVAAPPAAPVAAPACSLPLTHDTNDGFHIGVPAGWDLSALQGRIEVKRDASETEAVVVVPALQTSGLTAQSFFTSTLNGLQQQVQSGGATFTITGQSSGGEMPEDTFTATVSGRTLQGRAGLVSLPLRTDLTNTELVFTMYWAPSGSLTADEPMLRSVAQCFGPEKGSLFTVVKDPVFTYELAPGWSVADENQNGIDLHTGAGADVSYLLAEALPQQAGSSPQSFIDYVLAQDNVTGVTAISTVGGGGQSTEYEEFTGSLNGQPVHGVISGELTQGVSPSGVIRLALSDQGMWNSITGALVQMAGFIQHDFTQDLQQLQQISRQWQNFSAQVANFDDTLNNQQLVQDPNTGKLYEAPYSAFGDGTQGPGYYLDNGWPGGQRLTEVERA